MIAGLNTLLALTLALGVVLGWFAGHTVPALVRLVRERRAQRKAFAAYTAAVAEFYLRQAVIQQFFAALPDPDRDESGAQTCSECSAAPAEYFDLCGACFDGALQDSWDAVADETDGGEL